MAACGVTLNLGLIIARYRRKTRVKLALFKTGHVNYIKNVMIRAHNDKDKVIVLQTSQTHLPESSALSLIKVLHI